MHIACCIHALSSLPGLSGDREAARVVDDTAVVVQQYVFSSKGADCCYRLRKYYFHISTLYWLCSYFWLVGVSRISTAVQ